MKSPGRMIVLLPKALAKRLLKTAMTRKLPPDFGLWEEVARTVKPLHKTQGAEEDAETKAEATACGGKARIARPSRHRTCRRAVAP